AIYLPRGCGGRNPLTMVRLYRTQMARLETLESVSAVVTLSEHMAGEMIRNGVDAERVHVVPPFVSGAATPFESASDRTPGAPIRLVYLGRLERLKGADRLLAAMPIVASAIERPVWLTVAGDGSQRAELERVAAALCAKDARLRIE